MSSTRINVPLRPGSDGDATHVPKQGTYTQVEPPTLYLEKIGQRWMEARGEARPGTRYILDSLPAGYTMWQRPRPSDPMIKDKYLYGHPNFKYFDSPNRFYPHFEYLMENSGDSMGCPCTVCGGGSGVLPSRTSSSSGKSRSSTVTPQAQSRTSIVPQLVADPLHFSQEHVPSLAVATSTQQKDHPKIMSPGRNTAHVDEEGTPDVYRNLIDKLKRHHTIDEPIREPLSPDWIADQEALPQLLQSLGKQEQWVPRNGEIILYIRDLPSGVALLRHEVTGEFQLYDEEMEEFLSYPRWEAGLVGQTPAGQSKISDLVERNREEQHVIYSGVRVEPLPNPNSSDKSLSKQYKYISLWQVRPFILWHEFMQHIPRTDWHPTIINALTLTSTLSLMGTYRFRGVWPNANIYTHGIYIGFEMIAVGDSIRLLPSTKSGQATCTDIMVIKSIRLKWSDLDMASDNDYDQGKPYKSEVWIYGSAYTSDASRSNKAWLSDQNVEPPKVAADYGAWYPLHPPSKELAVPYFRVLGRVYERHAMNHFLNTDSGEIPSIDTGRESLENARIYSSRHDQRIVQNENASWYWGDNRADALSLQTVNGLEVARFDQQRDAKDGRKKIQRIEALATENRSMNKNVVSNAADFSGRLRGFMAPDVPSLTATKQEVPEVNMDDVPTRPQSDEDPMSDGADHSGEDDIEIRQATKIIEDNPEMARKRTKVMIVID